MSSHTRDSGPDRIPGSRSSLIALIGFVALVSILNIPVKAASSGAPLAATASPDPVWNQWVSALKEHGVSVTQGIAAVRDCPTYISVFGNCLDSNPSSGYFDILPPIDDTYIDPCYNPAHDCSGATPNTFTMQETLPDGSQTSVNEFYRLGTTDALVVIVNLPPNAAYFGYQSYVYTRRNSAYSLLGCLIPTGFADPCRRPVLGSVGNSINNVSLFEQTGLPLGTGGSVAFITTANQALYADLSSVFQQIGGASTRLIAEPLANRIVAGPYTATVYPGTDSAADEMDSLIRYSLPQNPSDADAWQNSPATNIQVFRMRKTDVANTRFESTVYAAKHYSTDENTYRRAVAELTNDLQQWLQSQATDRVTVAPLLSLVKISKTTGEPAKAFGIDILGPYCLVKGSDCYRDTQDTDTYRVWLLPSSLDRTAAIVGVDSTQTDNATYIGVGITDFTILEGVAAQSQTNPLVTGFSSGALTGSASDLVNSLTANGLIPPPSPTLAAALPKLFVALATRACPSGSTALICNKPYTMNIDDSQIPPDHQIQLTRRTYVHPGDANGPNPNYILPTYVVY